MEGIFYMDINYEDELEEVLWKGLKRRFGLDDDSLLPFIMERFFIFMEYKENPIKSYKYTDINCQIFFDFIFNELNITSYEYKKCKIGFIPPINNLKNILYSWHLNHTADVEQELIGISKYAKQKYSSIMFGKNKNKEKQYLILFKLERLNELYDVNEIKNITIKGFSQSINPSLEDEISWVLGEDDVIEGVFENDLEDYIIQHLEDIEEGLTYMGRQIILDEGRIDILAKDANDGIVIIELKIKADKRIVWQCAYYPMEIQKRYPHKNIRMFVIMPNYPRHLLEPLRLFNVEKFAYNIKVSRNKIKKLEIRKVQ
jgi:hypothetical protein